jgi:YHS domain-containing protein
MEITMARVLSKVSLFFIVLSLISMAPVIHAAPKINTLEKSGLFGKYKDSGIAIRGFDTVAYFTQGKPVKGSADYVVNWSGATWQFASQEHADLFKADPEAYAPQYGGYCAYGVAQDYLVKIEGDQWKIEDGKLYLNYDRKVQSKWIKDIPGYIATANSKFDALLNK